MRLQISGKDLGALAMKGFCPRCFWISRRARLPWQIFPGIFSSIDSYSKKVVHGQFDKSGMPGWLAPLGELKGYKDPPSAQRFRVPVEEHGLLLTEVTVAMPGAAQCLRVHRAQARLERGVGAGADLHGAGDHGRGGGRGGGAARGLRGLRVPGEDQGLLG
jgi:hypothetical protein